MTALAHQYAAALADVALERQRTEKFQEELVSICKIYEESADLRHFLTSPAVDAAAKRELIERLSVPLRLSAELKNFLFVVIQNRRTQLLEEIRTAFVSELHARLGVAEAKVTSARELSREEKQQLVRALENLTGKKVQATYGLDENLLGGTVVQIGSTVYDGSVRERLNRLRARLESE